MRHLLIPVAVFLCVLGFACKPLDKQVIGRWVGSESTFEFSESGSFFEARGLITQKGRYYKDGEARLALEYTDLISQIKETIAGPSRIIVGVKVEGETLTLTWPEQKVRIYHRSRN